MKWTAIFPERYISTTATRVLKHWLALEASIELQMIWKVLWNERNVDWLEMFFFSLLRSTVFSWRPDFHTLWLHQFAIQNGLCVSRNNIFTHSFSF
jgi:hypothetical protein